MSDNIYNDISNCSLLWRSSWNSSFYRGQRGVRIDVDIRGLKKGLHGFHVHECGDMSDRCESMCAHFNPYRMDHGGPGDKVRHVGDLGNIVADGKGCARTSFIDNVIRLRGTKANIIGRGLIIHADEDDLGKGDKADSLTTGHAGKRVACAVIGYANRPMKNSFA